MIIHDGLRRGVCVCLAPLHSFASTVACLSFAAIFRSFSHTHIHTQSERYYIYELITEKSLKSKLRAYWTRCSALCVCNACHAEKSEYKYFVQVRYAFSEQCWARIKRTTEIESINIVYETCTNSLGWICFQMPAPKHTHTQLHQMINRHNLFHEDEGKKWKVKKRMYNILQYIRNATYYPVRARMV